MTLAARWLYVTEFDEVDPVGPPPLGYRRNREVLPNGKIARVWTEPDPDVAPIVQLIFREYASGLYSLKSLARKLGHRGLNGNGPLTHEQPKY